jgi:hypothetical protein
MLARLSVEALLSNPEPGDGLATDDVRFDDFGYILQLDMSIPDAFGVDDYIGTVFALIEASRLIGSHSWLEPASGQLLLESELKICEPVGVTAAPWIVWRPLICADENMMLKMHVQRGSVPQEVTKGQVGAPHWKRAAGYVPQAVQPAADLAGSPSRF